MDFTDCWREIDGSLACGAAWTKENSQAIALGPTHSALPPLPLWALRIGGQKCLPVHDPHKSLALCWETGSCFQPAEDSGVQLAWCGRQEAVLRKLG